MDEGILAELLLLSGVEEPVELAECVLLLLLLLLVAFVLFVEGKALAGAATMVGPAGKCIFMFLFLIKFLIQRVLSL